MMKSFPRVEAASGVDPALQASAIDFVNRVNWLFETWDVEAMVQAFLPDGVTFHFHGVIKGHEEMRRFFEREYPYLIPGISRHATNHIVDLDGDGVAVRYHNLLIRYAAVEAAPDLGAGKIFHSPDQLPAIWIYSPILDRLRRVDSQWKIFERHLGGSMTNQRLEPRNHDPRFLAAFMPKLGPQVQESAK
jgi:hypothetical protein